MSLEANESTIVSDDAAQQPAGAPDPQAQETPPLDAPAAAVERPTRQRGANGRFTKEDKREAFLEKQRQIVSAAAEKPPEQIAVERLDPSGESADGLDDPADDEAQRPEGDDSPAVDPVASGNDGPSPDLVAIAERLGVDRYVIDMAKSDDALHIAIAMAAPHLAEESGEVPAQQLPQQRQQVDPGNYDSLVPEDFQVKFMIPEDYGDPEDPIVQQNKHLVERMQDLQLVVSQLAGEVMSSRKAREQEQRGSVQQKFDQILDESEWFGVGKRAELKDRRQTEVRVRSAMFAEVEKIVGVLPNIPMEQAAEIAYQQVFGKKPAPKKTPKEAARIEAIKRSNQRILGTGSGGPAPPEPELSKQERFFRRVAQIRAQR